MSTILNGKNGQILEIGGELMSSYQPHMMKHLIKDFYVDAKNKVLKSAGFTGYNTLGVFNAIMGKEISIGVFASNTMLTAIGARPYDHAGVRINYSLAKKGGIGTVRDGPIPASVKAPIKQATEPYKDLPYAFDYGLGLKAVENHDDTIAYQQYIDMMIDTYSDGLDYDLLRPLTTAQPVDPEGSGEEICINGISRVFASSAEVGQTYGTTEITGAMVSPWGGVDGSFYDNRTAQTVNNFDGYVNNASGVLSAQDMNDLYANCAMYWKDSANPNNKIFGMSIVAQEKLGALDDAKKMYLDSVFVQRDFNGVKTLPGRELGGILANSWRNVPIMVDGNYNYDLTIDRIGNGLGEIHLLDLDHFWLSVLTPIEFRSTDDFAITRNLREQCAMTMRAEVRADKFIGSGRICNKTVE